MYYNLYIHGEPPKRLRWDPEKSRRLKELRGVSFEEIVRSRLVTIAQHSVRPNQKVYIFEYHDYLWAVPYVTDQGESFLKTIYPSRKLTKAFKKGKYHEKE